MEKTYKILKLVIWILSFAVVIVGAYVLYNRLSPQVEIGGMISSGQVSQKETEETQNPAPDFTVYDAEGNAHKLSDFQGKPVVLNFWASWCGPCVGEMPEFQNFYEQYGEQIHFLMVNMTDGYQETVENASAFIAQQGYSFPVYYDTDIDAAMVYGVNAIPVTYFIDENGNLEARAQGALSADRLRQGIDMLMEDAA